MAAIADISPVDVPAVVDPGRHHQGGKVDMPPGLCPIGGGSEGGREYLSRIELCCGPWGDARAGARHAIADPGDVDTSNGVEGHQRGRQAGGPKRAGREELVIRYRTARHDDAGYRLFRRYREGAAV